MIDVQFLSNGRRGTSCTEQSFYSNPANEQHLNHGCDSVSLALGDTFLVEQHQDKSKKCSNRYMLHPILRRYLQSHFEEIFGASLTCDLFSNSDTSSSCCCLSRLIKGNCYLILADPQDFSEVFLLLVRSSIIALLIVPDWFTHSWHKTLVAKASHRFVLPVGAVQPEWSDTKSTSAYLWDTRYSSRAADLVTLRVPEIDKLALRSFPPPPATQ